MLSYVDAIEELVMNPRRLFGAWHAEAPLFAYCSKHDQSGTTLTKRPDGKRCGCLTMIHSDVIFCAWTDALTEEIRADERIPDDMTEFHEEFQDATPADRRAMLAPFAEWQERLDRELNREPVC